MAIDTINVQRGIVGAGADNDTYILSANLIDANADITISDTEGTNKLHLIGGLEIVSSIVVDQTAQLTLSNGAVVTVLGADTFEYEAGGNPLTGEAGVVRNYATFATEVLGTTVPAAGQPGNNGGASTINADGSATGGDPNAPTYALTAGLATVDEGGAATFTLATTNVAEGTEVAYTLSGVDAADITGGSLTGTATVGADGTAVITVNVANDSTTEGAETLTVTIDGQSASASTVINDTSIEGQTFTLNNSDTPDNLTGLSANDDTINGIGGNSFGDKADIVLDVSTADNDVANIFITQAPTAGTLMQNVENINVTLGGSASLANVVSGYNTVNLSSLAATNTLTLTSVTDNTTLNVVGTTIHGASGQAGNLTIDAASSSSSTINLGLAAGGSTTLDINGAAANEFQTVNIASTGGTANTVALATGTDRETSGDSFVVTGDTDLVITADLADMGSAAGAAVETTINGTAHTGNLTFAAQDATSANFWVDATKFTGVDTIRLGSTANVGLNTANVVNGLVSGMTVELSGVATTAGTDDLTVTLDSATSSTDELTVKLNNTAAAADLEFDDLTTTGINNVTIESTGSTATAAGATLKNSINSIVTTTGGSKLIVTGAKNFEVDGDVDELFTTIDASAATGNVDLTMATSAADLTFTGGAGNDRLDVQNLLTSADVLNGGDGTDTLVIGGVSNSVASTEVLTTGTSGVVGAISNFEVLELNDALDLATGGGDVTVSLTNETGLNSLKLSNTVTVDANDTFTVKGDDGMTLTLAAAGQTLANTTSEDNVIIQVTDAENAGTNNTVNLVLNNGTTTVSEEGFSIDGVENLNITQSDNHGTNVDTIADIHGQQLKNITLTGNQDSSSVNAQQVTITAVESTIVETIDASAFQGAVNVSGLAASLSGAGATLTGGTGVFTATGGAGADVVTGGAAADVLGGGAGNDAITGGTGADNITGGAGVDTITVGTNTDDDVDVVVANATDAANIAANRDVITGFRAGATSSDTYDIADATMTDNENAAFSATDFVSVTTSLVSGASNFNVSGSFDLDSAGLLEIETTLSANGDLSAATDGSELMKALSSTSTAAAGIQVADGTDDAADTFYILAYQGGKAYLYYANDGAGDDELLTGSDIALVGTFNDIEANAMVAANFV